MKRVHPLAGGVALATIAAFWLCTVASELSGSVDAVIAVKTAIPWGLLLLIPALMATGGSGFALAQGRGGRLLDAKRRRMIVVAANGILVLVPSALYLSFAARARQFDGLFVTVQAFELVAGAANVVLLGLNFADGLRMNGRLRRRVSHG